MDKVVTDAVIVCLVVLALDTAAGILGILGQAAQNKVECDQLVNEAYRLSFGAAALAIAAHASANLFGRCDCLCPQLTSIRASNRASVYRKLQLAAAYFSLIVFCVEASLLIAGALSKSCGFVHGHALALGGIMCFVHGMTIIAYYVAAIAGYHEDREEGNQRQ
ncbi:hypothetical protein ACP70R_045101 [Stipagrostis hirtigluma subsp. patula]